MNQNRKLINAKKYTNDRNIRDYYNNIDKNINAKNKLINEYNN